MSNERRVKAKVIKQSAAMHPIVVEQNNHLNDATTIEKSQSIDAEEAKVVNEDIIKPPYNQEVLILLSEQSSILEQCVEAYKTNVSGFGLEARLRVDQSNMSEAEKKVAESEKTKLNDFLSYINLETPIEEVLEAVQDDMEKTGNGYIEIIRSKDGQLSTFEHLPAVNMRLCKKDKQTHEITRNIEIDGKKSIKNSDKKFRRFVQVVGLKKVYFKEYGHPKDLNYKTGEYDKNIDYEDKATEVLHFKIGNQTYGKPRWLGNVINAVGARKAEELNYLYFKNGRHLPAAITVSNGMLDEDSRTELENYMADASGQENSFKWLLLESQGEETEGMAGEKKASNSKIDIQSLAQMIQQDALFLDYDDRIRKKIRSSFRLPPIYTGEAEEYNRATSDTARELTEEQVFQPLRTKIARRLNAVLLPELDIKMAKLVFKDADFRDPKEIAKVITPFIQANATSPNDLRPVLGEILGTKLEQWEEEYNRPVNTASRGAMPLLPGQSTVDINKSQEDIVHILKDLRDYLEGVANE